MQGWEKVMGFPLVGGGARASPSSLGPQAVVGGWRHNGQSRCINGEVMMALARTIRGTLVSMHEGQPDGEARIRERMQCPRWFGGSEEGPGGASAGGLGWSVDPGSEQSSGAEGRPDQGLGAGSGGGGSRSRSRHGLTTMGEMSLVPLNSIAASDPGPQRLQHWAWMPTPPSSVPGLQSWGVPSPYWALSMERVPREAPSRQSGLLSLWRALHPQHVLPPCGPRCQPSHPGPGAGSYT